MISVANVDLYLQELEQLASATPDVIRAIFHTKRDLRQLQLLVHRLCRDQDWTPERLAATFGVDPDAVTRANNVILGAAAEHFHKSVDEFDGSVRLMNVLQNQRVATVGELTLLRESFDVKRWQHMGSRTVRELRELLRDVGLDLRHDLPGEREMVLRDQVDPNWRKSDRQTPEQTRRLLDLFLSEPK